MAGAQHFFTAFCGIVFCLQYQMSSAAAADLIGNRLPGAQLLLEAGLENFRWRERDDDGERLLTEQGPRFVFGAALSNHPRMNDGMIYEIHLGGHLAEVDYDGQDTNGRYIGTVTDYSGWNVGINGGYCFAGLVEGAAVDVFAGLGMDNWRRDINGGTNAIGQPISGVAEDYSVDYLQVGLGVAHGESYADGYLQMGFRRPLSIDEEARINGQTVQLSPREAASGFLSYRVFLGGPHAGKAPRSYLKFYYASYRLKKSGVVDVGANTVWQPRSNMDALGIMLGYAY